MSCAGKYLRDLRRIAHYGLIVGKDFREEESVASIRRKISVVIQISKVIGIEKAMISVPKPSRPGTPEIIYLSSPNHTHTTHVHTRHSHFFTPSHSRLLCHPAAAIFHNIFLILHKCL